MQVGALRAFALAMYAAAVVLVGVVVHILAEAVALGESPFATTELARHTYLLALGGGALAVLAGLTFSLGNGSRATVAHLARALPFASDPQTSIAVAALAQFALFVLAIAAEGVPLDLTHLGIALAVALVASLAGAVAVVALQRDLFLRAVRQLVEFLAHALGVRPQVAVTRARALTVIPAHPRAIPTVANRPPPSPLDA